METRPLRPFFEETRRHRLAPHEKYAAAHQWLGSQGIEAPDGYFSTTMTSGGHVRGINKADPVAFDQAQKRNYALAEALMDTGHAQGSFATRAIIFPPDMGVKEGWRDMDYETFWFHWIAGVEPEAAPYIEAELKRRRHVDGNNHLLENGARVAHFHRLAHHYANILKRDQIPYRPVQVMYQGVDHHLSVGCQGEEVFSRRLQIPVVPVILNNLESPHIAHIRDEVSELINRGVRFPQGDAEHASDALIIGQLSFNLLPDVREIA